MHMKIWRHKKCGSKCHEIKVEVFWGNIFFHLDHTNYEWAEGKVLCLKILVTFYRLRICVLANVKQWWWIILWRLSYILAGGRNLSTPSLRGKPLGWACSSNIEFVTHRAQEFVIQGDTKWNVKNENVSVEGLKSHHCIECSRLNRESVGRAKNHFWSQPIANTVKTFGPWDIPWK